MPACILRLAALVIVCDQFLLAAHLKPNSVDRFLQGAILKASAITAAAAAAAVAKPSAGPLQAGSGSSLSPREALAPQPPAPAPPPLPAHSSTLRQLEAARGANNPRHPTSPAKHSMPLAFDTLEPGYLSRPNPSPAKPPRPPPQAAPAALQPAEHGSGPLREQDVGSNTIVTAVCPPARNLFADASPDVDSPGDVRAAAVAAISGRRLQGGDAQAREERGVAGSDELFNELRQELVSAQVLLSRECSNPAPQSSDDPATRQDQRSSLLSSQLKSDQHPVQQQGCGVTPCPAPPGTDKPRVAGPAGRKRKSAGRSQPAAAADLLPLPQRLFAMSINQYETDVLAGLPLPSWMTRLQAVFTALNEIYNFQQAQHVQSNWRNTRQALGDLLAPQGITPAADDMTLLAALCPEVVMLSSPGGGSETNYPAAGTPNQSLHTLGPEFVPLKGGPQPERSTDAPLSSGAAVAQQAGIPLELQHFGINGKSSEQVHDGVMPMMPTAAAAAAAEAVAPQACGNTQLAASRSAEIAVDGAGAVMEDVNKTFVIELVDPGRYECCNTPAFSSIATHKTLQQVVAL